MDFRRSASHSARVIPFVGIKIKSRFIGSILHQSGPRADALHALAAAYHVAVSIPINGIVKA